MSQYLDHFFIHLYFRITFEREDERKCWKEEDMRNDVIAARRKRISRKRQKVLINTFKTGRDNHRNVKMKTLQEY